MHVGCCLSPATRGVPGQRTSAMAHGKNRQIRKLISVINQDEIKSHMKSWNDKPDIVLYDDALVGLDLSITKIVE